MSPIARSAVVRTCWLFATWAISGSVLGASEVKNCPVEPTQNVAIVSGNVFAGSNCTISPGVDVDSFKFSGKSGDSWRITAAMDAGAYPNNICVQVYDPATPSTVVFAGCSDTYHGVVKVSTYLTLPIDGAYTIVVNEAGGDATINYGLSLERKYPAPADARIIALGESVADDVELADVDAYSFSGSTTGTYRVSASISDGGYPANLCVDVWGADGGTLGSKCSDTYHGVGSVAIDVTPTVNGKVTAMVYEASGSRALGYGLNAACLVGDCGTGFPPCTLKNTATYDATTQTLTMKFTIGHQYGGSVTWNGWLTRQNGMERLFKVTQPLTDPPVVVTRTRTSLPKSGKVGVLSTLTTPSKGIACQSWVQVGTGAP